MLLGRALCHAMRDVLRGGEVDATWSRRTVAVVEELRASHAVLEDGDAPLVAEADRVRWWTFAGGRANNLLARLLTAELGDRVSSNNLCVTISGDEAQSDVAIRQAVEGLEPKLTWAKARELAPESARGRVSKFQPCLPLDLELDLLARHLMDVDGARWVVEGDLVFREAQALVGLRRELIAAAEVLHEPDAVYLSPKSGLERGPRLGPTLPVTYVDTFDALDALAPKWLKERVIAFDVETTFQRDLCLAQVGTREGSWLIDALAIDDLSPLARVLESPRVQKVIQYAQFERDVMARVGVDVANVFDTCVGSKMRHGTKALGGHSLAALCERGLGVHLDKAEQTGNWRRRSLTAEQVAYAALDVEVLLRLYDELVEDRAPTLPFARE